MRDYKAFFILFVVVVFACTSNPPKKTTQQTTSLESKQLANEEESSYVTEMNFSKGSTELSKSARAHLRETFEKAKAHEKVIGAKVITWADREYPSANTEKLTDAEQKLVDERNNHIDAYLRDLDGDIKIENFSMAKRPDSLSKLFSTDDAKLKRSLETAGIPNTDTTVKVPGKASKSIVIFITDDRRL